MVGWRGAEVAGELQFALLRHAGDAQPALVGIAGQRHELAVEENLRAPAGLGDLAKILRAERLQTALQHLAACRFIQPRKYARIRHRFPVGYHPTADQPHRLVLDRPVNDGRIRRPAILREVGVNDLDNAYTPPRNQTVTTSFGSLRSILSFRISSRARSSVANGFALVPGLVCVPVGANGVRPRASRPTEPTAGL